MKKFKSLFLPAIIVLMGVGAAFATSSTKSPSDSIPGYLFDNTAGKCVEKRSNCSISGTEYCSWVDASQQSHDLSMLVGTNCVIPLYEP